MYEINKKQSKQFQNLKRINDMSLKVETRDSKKNIFI